MATLQIGTTLPVQLQADLAPFHVNVAYTKPGRHSNVWLATITGDFELLSEICRHLDIDADEIRG